MEIGNPELVNLLVENRIAEIEAEVARLDEDRVKLEEAARQIMKVEEEAMVKLVTETNAPHLTKIVELYELMTGSELPPLDIIPHKNHSSPMKGQCYVCISWDDDKYVLSEEQSNFVESLRWMEAFPVNAATAAGYASLIEDINANRKKVNDLEGQMKNREAIGRKMLAKLTAKTLQDNPEMHKHVLETASNIGGGLFIESKV